MQSGPYGHSIRTALFALVVTIGGGVRVAAAQQPENCAYTTCALRVQYRSLGTVHIVQGDPAIRVDGNGVFSRRVRLFESRSDSVRFHYVEYRSHAKRAGLLAILGAFAVSAGTAIDYSASDGNKVAKISLIGSGIIVGAIAKLNHSRSEDHLQQAIWLYNRDLPR